MVTETYKKREMIVRAGIAWWLALLLTGINLLMIVVSQVLGLVFAGRLINDARVLAAIVYGVIALMIIARQHRHTVGWIFIATAFFSAAGALRVGLSGLEPSIASKYTGGWIALIGHLSWSPALLLPVTLVLLYFPDGQLPSRRWWPISIAAIVGIAGFMVSSGFYPDPYNPVGIQGATKSLDFVSDISTPILGIGAVGSLFAVWIRYRRSRGVEKVQMKWLVYTAVIGISLMMFTRVVIGLMLDPSGDESVFTVNNPIADVVYQLLPSLLAVAIAIAILRHRLFDIDVIIRRTIQYAILTGILALIYFGTVVTLQGVFSTIGGQESPIFIVISTLVIAGLFNPLRLRIQEIIDRRFYRRKYEAEKALAQFAAAARDEVDLDHLSTALLSVVQETIQPEHISLWLAAMETENSI